MKLLNDRVGGDGRGGDASKAEFKEKAVDSGDFFFYLERKE